MGSCFSSRESPLPSQTSGMPSKTPYVPGDSSLPLNPYFNKIHEIISEEQLNRLLNDIRNTNVLIVCDFYAMWCLPCLHIAPVLSKWALNDYRTNVIFMKIDADKNDDILNRFIVTVLPTFVLFKQGKEISRLTGADSTNLRKEIDKFK